ncbi:MAG: hypothetical protein ACLFTE_10615, partial [Salinivenus sp.]
QARDVPTEEAVEEKWRAEDNSKANADRSCLLRLYRRTVFHPFSSSIDVPRCPNIQRLDTCLRTESKAPPDKRSQPHRR